MTSEVNRRVPTIWPNRLPRILTTFDLLLFTVIAISCTTQPFRFDATGPFGYSAPVDPPFERVAVMVTIVALSGDDLQVNPADFIARDTNHGVYPANPAAAVADAHAVRLAHGVQNISPLPALTLRQNDTVSGFVVFDVPAGVRPVELIWRQTDSDYVVPLNASH